ncbi:unnamed protein product [Effrenium voratum]|uniref:Ion transport domain-containing protein n=1 Tax=Effrenium voratum TaxID=2562239 RepID=A0AA36I6G5_9DINO|nr:unnamed protein product [Effrenium voratum]
MFASLRVLFWAIAMLVVICYIFGILIFTLSKDAIDQDPTVAENWGGVAESMLSLLQIATYNGADIIRRRTKGSDAYLFMPVMFGFMAICSLGIINLIVGVLLTAVLERGNQDEMFENTIMKLRQHRALRRLRFGLVLHAEKTLGKNKDGSDGSHLVSRRILQGWARGPDAELTAEEMDDVEDEEALQEHIQDIQTGHTNLDALKGKGLGVVKVRKKGPCGRCVGAIRERFCLPFIRRYRKWRNIEATKKSAEKEDLRLVLPRLFEVAGVSSQDIDAVCTEVENLMGDNAGITIDEFVEALMFMKSRAHPLDIVGIMRGLWLVYERMTKMDVMFSAVGDQLMECRSFLGPLLQKFTPERAEMPKVAFEEEMATSSKAQMPGQEDRQLLIREQEQRVIEKSQTSFDMFFASVLLLNAVKLGTDAVLKPERLTDLESSSFASAAMAWFTLETIFITTFTAELFLRAIFKYQIEVQGEHELVLCVVPKFALTMTFSQSLEVISYSSRLLLDKMFIFDVVMVLVSLVDSFILRFVAAGENPPALRLVGLCRLIRLVRLLHLIKDLGRMVRGFVGNFQLIFRSVCIMTIFIYASAVLMVDFVGQNEETQEDANIQEKWGRIPDCMITLFTMATLSGWAKHVDEVAAYPSLETVMPAFTIMFLAICSLGILNLVTGVMVQTAFALLKEESAEKNELKLSKARKVIHQVMDECYDTMEQHLSDQQRKVQDRVNQMRSLYVEWLASGGKPRKLQSSGTAEWDAEEAPAGEKPEKEGELLDLGLQQDTWPVSAFDDDNYAEVRRVLWVSEVEIAVDVLLTLEPGSATEAHKDPAQSLLSWDGGGKSWPCLVMQQDLVKEEDDDEAPRRRGKLLTIVFRPVAFSRVFNFRFGGNFTSVRVRAGFVHGSSLLEESELEDLTPVDRALVTIRELNYLLQDRAFARSLDLIGLRPDQALMVYQKLNLTNTERVKVHDFMQAIMRMKRPVQGLDVAVAKSLMRRLVLEVEELATNSVRCQDCFRAVSEQLREVDIIDNMPEVATSDSRVQARMTSIEEEPVELESRAGKYYNDLMRRNRQMEIKIASIKAFVQQARSKAAEEEGGQTRLWVKMHAGAQNPKLCTCPG